MIAASLALLGLMIAFNVANLHRIHRDGPHQAAHILIAVDLVAALIVAWSLHLLLRREQ